MRLAVARVTERRLAHRLGRVVEFRSGIGGYALSVIRTPRSGAPRGTGSRGGDSGFVATPSGQCVPCDRVSELGAPLDDCLSAAVAARRCSVDCTSHPRLRCPLVDTAHEQHSTGVRRQCRTFGERRRHSWTLARRVGSATAGPPAEAPAGCQPARSAARLSAPCTTDHLEWRAAAQLIPADRAKYFAAPKRTGAIEIAGHTRRIDRSEAAHHTPAIHPAPRTGVSLARWASSRRKPGRVRAAFRIECDTCGNRV